jgi:hypothetical protein
VLVEALPGAQGVVGGIGAGQDFVERAGLTAASGPQWDHPGPVLFIRKLGAKLLQTRYGVSVRDLGQGCRIGVFVAQRGKQIVRQAVVHGRHVQQAQPRRNQRSMDRPWPRQASGAQAERQPRAGERQLFKSSRAVTASR